jgi:hypothetical protein
MAQNYRKSFNAPIPGQSLTAELGARPWQHPPQYATVEEAMDFYAPRILEPQFRDNIVDVMELGIPLTTIANSLQSGGVMQGKHSIDVGILIMPVLIEMLSYVGDEEGVDYTIGTEMEEEDKDKFRDSTIAKAMRNAKKVMEEAGSKPVEELPETGVEEESMTEEPAPAGLMARRQ